MDCNFEVRELPKKQYQHKQVFKGQWTQSNNFGSEKFVTEDFQK